SPITESRFLLLELYPGPIHGSIRIGIHSPSTAPRRGPARLAFQASAIPHQREVGAFGTGLADIALSLGLGAAHRLGLAHGLARARLDFVLFLDMPGDAAMVE